MEEDTIREELVQYLRAWARHGVYFGTSCTWRMLEQHVSIFNTMCVDTGPQTLSALLQMRQRIPPGFHLSCVLLNESMTYRYPHRHPDPAKRGILNTHFLNAGPVQEHLDPLEQPGAPRVHVLLPIDHVYRTEGVSSTAFLDLLARFLDGLSPHHRYAIEIHNREYLPPEYFDVLRDRNITHVLNTCTTMPTVLEQVQLPHVFTTDTVIVRAALRSNAETVLGIKETVRRCINERRSLHVYIDDGVGDSCAPASIARLMKMMNSDLARLSPIKKLAA
jgi:hypothetical protein